jgi:D-sedoheptulose 7-phosphate isomerase
MLSERAVTGTAARVASSLRARNPIVRAFFASEALRLAHAAQEMAERFGRGGRLYAFGRGPYATDAAHVSVEFVHPVIVGKRALPALDISAAPQEWVDVLVGADDMAVAFGPPQGDAELLRTLSSARRKRALTLALPGADADYAFAAPADDAHVHQEIFEILGHTLYESVHVFFEHREMGHDVGASGFLYPYLGAAKQDTATIVADVARSIVAKAHDGERLRDQVAERQAESIASAVRAIADRLARGGRLFAFGNGGSATDATDFALDCVQPQPGMAPIPAISLSSEAATMSAIANDVGVELTFVRQIIARCGPNDIAFALSTSGGSKNVVAALGEARRRGMLTIALLGYDGGEIARGALSDHTIVVDCDHIPRIQETQAAIYHVIRNALAFADA